MKFPAISRFLPDWRNALLALLSAGLLILAFPPFELWIAAWFALVPLLWAVEREKNSRSRPFVLGWLFGNMFFFGTCWWLTFAPITYADFPAPLAYFLLFCVTSVAAVFPGLFAAICAFLLRRFGSIAFLSVPFVWVFTEFLRYWLTGNNWNSIGYSQAFTRLTLSFAGIGGVLFVSLICCLINIPLFLLLFWKGQRHVWNIIFLCLFAILMIFATVVIPARTNIGSDSKQVVAEVTAIQPNVPMSGLTLDKWRDLRKEHVQLAETALTKIRENRSWHYKPPNLIIFPESPMNFMYEDDPETKEFINGFAKRNSVNVLFNSAEPDASNGKYFNSAVMVGAEGKEVAQYDKIYLLPFGEAVPFPLEGILPGFVGNFSYGREYDLLPLGEAKAGVMICFESHFGQLSREYVRNGADVIIEMTNDGYLGPTPVLRQHLANAVFRAVETNRPVLRVTNVGITAYINERGEVLDAADSYVEATRVWSVTKSDGSQTFYVKYGDWFAWLCTIITVGLLGLATFWKNRIFRNRE
ncbi:MAG: apolipoprotein N-acyltransferase [Acidobacteria bacterium]|nr:apolipoprotein N-acyltransferase [Acidobacteriota bacterium]